MTTPDGADSADDAAVPGIAGTGSSGRGRPADQRASERDASLSDGELLFQMARGEESAYRSLFRRHERAAYRVALLMVRSPWDAEDVVSTAFLELWRRRDHVRLVEGSIRPWLLTVVSFAAKNHLRTSLRYGRLLSKLPHSGDEPDHADEVARTMDAVPMTADVRDALRELSARDANVLLLCVVQELTPAAAATVLGIPESTVSSRLHRVKARLRTRLSKYAPSTEGAEA